MDVAWDSGIRPRLHVASVKEKGITLLNDTNYIIKHLTHINRRQLCLKQVLFKVKN